MAPMAMGFERNHRTGQRVLDRRRVAVIVGSPKDETVSETASIGKHAQAIQSQHRMSGSNRMDTHWGSPCSCTASGQNRKGDTLSADNIGEHETKALDHTAHKHTYPHALHRLVLCNHLCYVRMSPMRLLLLLGGAVLSDPEAVCFTIRRVLRLQFRKLGFKRRNIFWIGSPSWIRTTLAASKARCPAARRRGITGLRFGRTSKAHSLDRFASLRRYPSRCRLLRAPQIGRHRWRILRRAPHEHVVVNLAASKALN
jgi:hypothetical protein